ncbi:MAG: sarcosine oxidase subunit delta [Rhodobacteraceae bacterium]|nr:sarcosine oxidase subunit delta [Paracoccaceae bacterium]
MLKFECPYCHCGVDETELVPGGEAHIRREGPGADDEAFEKYLFLRENPVGVHFERWRHAFGCGKWFHVARCTQTMEVFGTYPAQTLEPPRPIQKAVNSRRAG